jgi:putative N6-adenine-specific DNA methylase
MKLSLFLICPRGLEEILHREISEIATRINSPSLRAHDIVFGGVSASGEWRDVMALNIWSRIASRVLLRMGHGAYRDEKDVYAITHHGRWHDWFSAEQTMRVDVTAQRSPLKSLQFATLTVKDAVCDAMRESTGERPSIDTAMPDVRVLAHLNESYCTVYLDTSGEPLFKRGWRNERATIGEAPIKENLAAGLVQLMAQHGGYDGTQVLLDPFCGSGTVLIEAAQWATERAPQLQAKPGRFGFERLSAFDAEAKSDYKELLASAKSLVRPLPREHFFGRDISAEMVAVAQRNAEAAGVAGIAFCAADAAQLAPVGASVTNGFLIANPPYGERMEAHTDDEAAQFNDAAPALFKAIGQRLKADFQGWQVWMISGDNALPKQLGFSPKRKVPLFNGAIETRFFGFDLVRGVYRPRSTSSAPVAANSVTD